jgi:hypothetical protein
MTIKARYAGRCGRCGGAINAGDEMEWSRGQPTRHLTCPASTATTEPTADVIHIGGGSGYGCEGWAVGAVIARPRNCQAEAEYLVVLTTSRRYLREDGMSFGVGDDSGYLYSATCRPATADEAAPLVVARQAAETRLDARKAIAALHAEISRFGEYVERIGAEMHVVAGEQIDVPASGDRLYGGGDWFVIGAGDLWVWAVTNNGGDGDDWSANNVRTGGAGAIGRRVPATAELIQQIRALAAQAK